MLFVTVIAVTTAWLYYGSKNREADPRVVEARELYSHYDTYAQENNFTSVLSLLDSIDQVYLSVPHYIQSYERGVVDNNRAAVFITIALFGDTMQQKLVPIQYDTLSFDSLLNIAEMYELRAIDCYRNWKTKFDSLNKEEILSEIKADFLVGLEEFSEKEQEAFLNRRTEEIVLAQVEVNRRLSVALTNLGVVYRHRENYERAAELYVEAIDLWDQNLDAINNLNVILNKPKQKRSFIEKLFPPEKK
jgi:tetratricopeptide (TPR) repeat protein